MTNNNLMHVAEKHFRGNEFSEADRVCQEALAGDPRNAEALHLRGVILQRDGNVSQAAELFRQAIAIDPNVVGYHNNLGVALHRLGRLEESAAAYRRALQIKPSLVHVQTNLNLVLQQMGNSKNAAAARPVPPSPSLPTLAAGATTMPAETTTTELSIEQAFAVAQQHHQAGSHRQAEIIYKQILAHRPYHAGAMHYLGVLSLQAGKHDVAVELIRRAVALKPNYPEACVNLGNALQACGKTDEAIASLRQAIALRPDFAEAHHYLGNCLQVGGKLDGAIASQRKAIALRPEFVEAHSTLGNFLKARGRLDGAIASYRQAIALKPDSPEIFSNLGNVLRENEELDEAIAACRQAIALAPKLAIAHNNLGAALWKNGQPEEAIAAVRTAVALRPEYPEAHINLAYSLMAKGDFQEGWTEYEWRWKCPTFPTRPRNFSQPVWDGRPLDGATLLLHAEQGFGDTLQFIRYLPLVAHHGGKIIVECQPELVRLIQPLAGEIQVVARGEPLPAFDMHCPLLSLPRALGTTLESIPAQTPYLHPDKAIAEKWQQRLATNSKSLDVGLVWSGNKTHANDRNRSLLPSLLAPLAKVRGIRFHASRAEIDRLDSRAKRLRRDGGPDRKSRPGNLSRYSSRASRGGNGKGNVDFASVRRRLALDDRPRRLAVVSDGQSVPPEVAEGLEGSHQASSRAASYDNRNRLMSHSN
jgi:Flp pilus assembly protein TadD